MRSKIYGGDDDGEGNDKNVEDEEQDQVKTKKPKVT